VRFSLWDPQNVAVRGCQSSGHGKWNIIPFMSMLVGHRSAAAPSVTPPAALSPDGAIVSRERRHPGLALTRLVDRLRRLRAVALRIDEAVFRPSEPQLRLGELADLAGWTPAQLDRAFGAYAGETPLVRWRRLRLARARRLIEQGHGVHLLGLALDCGYGSAEAFSRAFRAVHGASPSAIRRHALTRSAAAPPALSVRRLPPLAIQYVPWDGPLDDSLQPFDELRASALQAGIARERRHGWAVQLDGPPAAGNGPVRLRAALLSEPLGAHLPGLERACLPPGEYAVLSLTGSYAGPSLPQLCDRIAGETGRSLCPGAPILRRFMNSGYLPAPHERRCELWLPLR
jgi:AraC-like DNA-binding protein/DNA gyrase inhibitor GyrI